MDKKLTYQELEQRLQEFEKIIHKRKPKEEEFLSTDQQFENIVQSLPDPTFVIDKSKRIVAWNRAIEDMTGLLSESMVGKGDNAYSIPFWGDSRQVLADFIMDPDLRDFSSYESVKRDGDGLVCEAFLPKFGNSDCGTHVWLKASPLYDKDGALVGAIESIRDITKQKQAEENLQKSEEKFRLIFDYAPLGILHFNNNGIITACNDNFVNIIGSSKETLIGLNMFDLHDKNIVQALENALKGQTVTFDGEYSSMTAIKVTPIRLIFGPVFSREKTVQGGIGIIEDISEQIQAESEREKLKIQLQQAQKMESIGTLAGGIAHDFNNILFPILGHTELLLKDIPESSPLRDSLDKIYTSTLRAKDLVKQILTFSRRGSSEFEPLEIQIVIKEALKLIRSTIPATIDIKQDIRDGIGVINADPTQIHQIVMNLSTNAYHAMEKTGGELNVGLNGIELGDNNILRNGMAPGLYACLTIADTGIGMDEDLIKKIFDPFFTTKEHGKGTGIGLSVVHGIVLNMNGAIEVNSEPGKGTEFIIYLPMVKKSLKKQEPIQVKRSVQKGNERIFLVDDEEEIIVMVKKMLEHFGYQVTSFTDSAKALETFCNDPEKFDMIITDMAMPNISGDKLSAEVKKIRPDIPVLLCTGYSETMSEENAETLGINGFLLKPIVMNDLFQKIREVLDDTYIDS